MPFNFLDKDRDYAHYKIGKYSYGKPTIKDWGQSTLQIGNFVSIAEDVEILLGGEHNTDWITTSPVYHLLKDRVFGFEQYCQAKSKGNVVIGNDVWIGYKALILSGVTIGDGAVIGAHSVVSNNVPPYAIVAGNPIKIIRYRFTIEQVKSLLNIKWWDWDIKKIEDNIELLLSHNIQGFIDAHT